MDCKDPNCRCGFSYNDTGRWLEVGDPGLGFAAVEHEPGWDFFDLQGPSHLDVLHVRRSFPIRLVRLYRHWPSSEVLQTALHPGGVQQLQLKVPEKAKRLARWIIAVCPSTLAFRGTKRVPPSMPLSAAAAAVAAAVSGSRSQRLGKTSQRSCEWLVVWILATEHFTLLFHGLWGSHFHCCKHSSFGCRCDFNPAL